MGLATWLFDADDHPLPASSAPVISHTLSEPSASVKFALAPGETYVLKTSLQTNRPPAVTEARQLSLVCTGLQRLFGAKLIYNLAHCPPLVELLTPGLNWQADPSALERACDTIATKATLELERAHAAW